MISNRLHTHHRIDRRLHAVHASVPHFPKLTFSTRSTKAEERSIAALLKNSVRDCLEHEVLYESSGVIAQSTELRADDH